MILLFGGYCMISLALATMLFLDALDDGTDVAIIAFLAVLLFWPLIVLFMIGCDIYDRNTP